MPTSDEVRDPETAPSACVSNVTRRPSSEDRGQLRRRAGSAADDRAPPVVVHVGRADGQGAPDHNASSNDGRQKQERARHAAPTRRLFMAAGTCSNMCRRSCENYIGRDAHARPRPDQGRVFVFFFFRRACWSASMGTRRAPRTCSRNSNSFPAANAGRCVSVQGLHRFYARGHGKVVASWMTREDREQAIADNLGYVNRVVRAALQGVGDEATIVFLGFSQGVAMAYRAAVMGERRAARPHRDWR